MQPLQGWNPVCKHYATGMKPLRGLFWSGMMIQSSLNLISHFFVSLCGILCDPLCNNSTECRFRTEEWEVDGYVFLSYSQNKLKESPKPEAGSWVYRTYKHLRNKRETSTE